MRIAAFDLGTKMGWAHNLEGETRAGTWILGTPKEIAAAAKLRLNQRCEPRFIRLLGHLKTLPRPIDWVVFENVEFVKSRMQAHLWATWRAALWTLANEGVNIDCLSTGKLKIFATGTGGADKDRMARALTLDPRYILHPKGARDLKTGDILDDNAVDALHLLAWAMKTFKA